MIQTLKTPLYLKRKNSQKITSAESATHSTGNSIKKESRRNFTQEESIMILNLILQMWSVLDSIDILSNSNLYRHRLKQTANFFTSELQQFLDALNIYDIDNEAFYKLMEEKKELILNVAKLRPENQAVINHIINKYHDNPEKVMQLLEIEIVTNHK